MADWCLPLQGYYDTIYSENVGCLERASLRIEGELFNTDSMLMDDTDCIVEEEELNELYSNCRKDPNNCHSEYNSKIEAELSFLDFCLIELNELNELESHSVDANHQYAEKFVKLQESLKNDLSKFKQYVIAEQKRLTKALSHSQFVASYSKYASLARFAVNDIHNPGIDDSLNGLCANGDKLLTTQIDEILNEKNCDISVSELFFDETLNNGQCINQILSKIDLIKDIRRKINMNRAEITNSEQVLGHIESVLTKLKQLFDKFVNNNSDPKSIYDIQALQDEYKTHLADFIGFLNDRGDNVTAEMYENAIDFAREKICEEKGLKGDQECERRVKLVTIWNKLQVIINDHIGNIDEFIKALKEKNLELERIAASQCSNLYSHHEAINDFEQNLICSPIHVSQLNNTTKSGMNFIIDSTNDNQGNYCLNNCDEIGAQRQTQCASESRILRNGTEINQRYSCHCTDNNGVHMKSNDIQQYQFPMFNADDQEIVDNIIKFDNHDNHDNDDLNYAG